MPTTDTSPTPRDLLLEQLSYFRATPPADLVSVEDATIADAVNESLIERDLATGELTLTTVGRRYRARRTAGLER